MDDTIGLVRQIATLVDQLGQSQPALGQVAAAIKVQLKQALVLSAQQASAQPPSSEMVPMGG